MTKNRKARFADATTPRPCQIVDLLSIGAAQGKKIQELSKLAGMNERDLRSTIQAERKRGALILSDNIHGYFLPESKTDIARFVRSMRQRAKEICAVATAAEKAMQERSNA